MTDPIPLAVWPPNPSPERLALLRQAYDGIRTNISVLPCPAVPGSPGRILAFGEAPPFYSDSAIIRPENVDKVESVRAALTHLLHAPEGAPGFFTGEMWLAALIPGAKLVAIEHAPEPVREPTLRFY